MFALENLSFLGFSKRTTCWEDGRAAWSRKERPIPIGGFPDPDKWEEPDVEEEPPEDDGIPWDQLVRDIKSHGRDHVADEYAVPRARTDEELAKSIFAKLGRRPSESPGAAMDIGDRA
jgi:hypothetical protein